MFIDTLNLGSIIFFLFFLMCVISFVLVISSVHSSTALTTANHPPSFLFFFFLFLWRGVCLKIMLFLERKRGEIPRKIVILSVYTINLLVCGQGQSQAGKVNAGLFLVCPASTSNQPVEKLFFII